MSQLHVPYSDVLQMNPREREYFLEFIVNDLKKRKEQVDQALKGKQK